MRKVCQKLVQVRVTLRSLKVLVRTESFASDLDILQDSVGGTIGKPKVLTTVAEMTDSQLEQELANRKLTRAVQ